MTLVLVRVTPTHQILDVAIDVLLHAGCPGCHPSPQRAELHGVGLVACAVASLVQLAEGKTYVHHTLNLIQHTYINTKQACAKV